MPFSFSDHGQTFVRRQTALVRRGLETAAERAAGRLEDDMPWARFDSGHDDDSVTLAVTEGEGARVNQAVAEQADEIVAEASAFVRRRNGGA